MNHSWKTRVLSMFLAVVMVVGMLPMNAFATDGAQEENTPTETVAESTPELMNVEEEGEEEPAEASYTVKHYLQNEDGTYPEEASETETLTGKAGTATAAAAKLIDGYVAQKFEQATIAEDGTTVVEICYAVEVKEEPKTAEYKVEHYLQNEDGTYPETATETETLTGNAGEKTAAAAKTVDGYAAQAFEQADIAEDGTTVVVIRYAVAVKEEPKTAEYKVEHYLETEEGYVLQNAETLTGTVGEQTVAVASAYEGYTAQVFEQVEITEDGAAVVAIYYTLDPVTVEQEYTYLPGETLISDKQSTLAPGVTLNKVVLNDSKGDRVEMYVTTADSTADTVKFYANYKDNQCASWGMQTLSEQVAAMEANYEEPFKIVAGINAAYYNTGNGAPTGAFVMEGVDASTSGNGYPFFAVLKDGSVMIGHKGQFDTYKSQIKEAIGGYVHLVKEGKICDGLNKVDKYPRQTIGLTADGKVILMTADGSQAPKTIGLTYYEQAEVMLALGCVEALHLDGGNSATFGTIPEGEDKFVTTNSPSGGGERAVSNTFMIVSTAVPDGTFDHAVITSEYDYFVPNSSYTFSAFGVDASNAAAEIPENAVWALSDDSFGTVENGTFVSNGKLGDVAVQMKADGKVVGSKTIYIVNPTAISFSGEETTVPYGKTAQLAITAVYNGKETFCNGDAFNWTVDPAQAGTMEGFAFTAADESDIAKAVVTAAYKYAENVENVSITVKFGKGSEVLFDFEDGDISDWLGVDTIGTWIQEKNEEYAAAAGESGVKYKMITPQEYGNGVNNQTSSTFLATEENGGKVKSGKNSLGITLDRLNQNNDWIYNYLYYTGDPQVWRDVANGKSAVRVGMWVYLPQNAANTAFRICRTFTKDASGKLYTNYDYMFSDYDGAKVSYNTNYGIPESGWIYVYFDLNAYDFQSSTQYNPNENYAMNNGKGADGDYYPAFIQFINQLVEGTPSKDTMDSVTIYIDDITLDYSDVTDDRDAPVISNVTVSTDGSNDVALNGQTVNSNLLSFGATVADVVASNATGLNFGASKIYVDGVDMSGKSGFVAAGSNLALNNVNLTDGEHSVAFVVYDNQGNETRVTKTLTVEGNAGNARVYLSGHNDGNNVPESGSVYYIDVMASDASQIRNVATTLKLNAANTFEYDHILCAEGVEVKTSYDALNHELTLQIDHDGTLTGKTALASVPVRVWSRGENCSTSLMFIDIVCETIQGNVTYADGAFAGYADGFHTELNVKTKLDNASAWHTHSAAALDDKAPDCTHTGYTGRTYCDGCKSVVAWGTTVAATGHSYDFVDGVLKCTCGETFTGVHTDGKEYVDGICMADGWNSESYYKDGVKLTGVQKVPAPESTEEFYYDFGEDGVCADKTKYTGVFLDQTAGVYRYAQLGVLTSGWQLIADEWYYFEADTMAAATGSTKVGDVTFAFEENGKLKSGVWAETLYGTRYYYGPSYYRQGWYNIDGKDYRFEDYIRLENGYYAIFENMAFPRWYYFNEEGVCDKNQVIQDGFYTNEKGMGYSKNGEALVGHRTIDGVNYCFNYLGYAQKGKINDYYYGDDYKGITGIIEVNGVKSYCQNGRLTMAGLVEVDGFYYFAGGTKGQIVTGKYYVWQGNGIVPNGNYEFDEEGKMLNGIVEKNGSYYYYQMGQPKMAGLIELDGAYYFAHGSKGEIATGVQYVWEGNGILPEGTYEFAEDGKMLDGIVKKDGGLYYYENGQYKMAGLVEVDSEFYFAAGAKGEVYTGKQYVWKSNDLVPNGTYEFDEEGRMRSGIVEVNGELCYYVKGQPKMAGLVEFDGAYYFAGGKNGQVSIGLQYVWEPNGLLPKGNYEFGEDGRMLQGIVEKNGELCYYLNGQPKMAGLIELDGAYYFAYGSKGQVATGNYYVWQGNDILPNGNYEFGADGKMLDGIVTKNGALHYYEKGQPKMAGLILADGAYYFAGGSKGEILTGKQYVWKSNGLMPEDTYEFDAEGKMVDGFVTKSDGIYYYENGKYGMVGLNYIDGYYYFIDYGGKVITNRTYYVWQTNGLSINMNYRFDEFGRAIV